MKFVVRPCIRSGCRSKSTRPCRRTIRTSAPSTERFEQFLLCCCSFRSHDIAVFADPLDFAERGLHSKMRRLCRQPSEMTRSKWLVAVGYASCSITDQRVADSSGASASPCFECRSPRIPDCGSKTAHTRTKGAPCRKPTSRILASA